jgi:DNA repair exonuclease SbcCD ATPase subunit
MRKHPGLPAGGPAAALVVTYGNTTRKHRPLDRDLTLLGRARNCDVPLVSPEVAPVHCLIARAAGGWLLRDCTGRGGTRLNGKAVTESALADGDVLQVGTFSFELQLPPEHPGPTPAAFQRLQHSRRNLAYLALELRKKVRVARACAMSQDALNDQAGQLRSLQQSLNNRRRQLEQTEAAFRQSQAAQDEPLAARTRQLREAEARLQTQRKEFEETTRRATQEHARRLEEIQRQAAALPSSEKVAALKKREEKLAVLAAKLVKARTQLAERLDKLDQQKAQLRKERAALAAAPEPAPLRAEAERLRASLAEQKAVSEAKRVELEEREAKLAREKAQLRKDQAALAAAGPEAAQLRAEAERLQAALAEQQAVGKAQRAELEALRALEGAQAAVVATSGGAQLQELIASLREEVKVRDALLEKMNRRLKQHAARPDADIQSYEAELNRYRLELERDRKDLNEQLQQLRQRHAEVEDAARETEIQMARERAQLAREQAELNRLRQELSRAQNRSSRELEVRERLAALKRPRQEAPEAPPRPAAPPTGLRRRVVAGRPTTTPA